MAKIGLEIHGYISSKEKLFCECPADYKEAETPNTRICPVCTAQPGSKPMLPNKEAIKKSIAISLMLGCKLSEKALVWQRKHYDWPDLPKGYQSTLSGSYAVPVGYEGNFQGIKIREVHLEEDPASWNPDTGEIDYNRCGLPLVEIVTEPDFKNSKEVREWLKNLIIALSYIKALEKDAGVKADVNVSTSGERVEIKNVNSFASITKAIEYETARQEAEAKQGIKIKRETRQFDEARGITLAMREKEQAEDYRFIPEPDLPVIVPDKILIEKIKKEIPELPQKKTERFVKEHRINKDAAEVLSQNREIAEFYEQILKSGIEKKLASYWVTIELLRILNWNKKALDEVDIKPEHFAELLKMIEKKEITETAAKNLLNKFIPKSFNPKEKLKETSRIEDKEELEEICQEIIKKNSKAVQDYKSGEKKALDFLIGQGMAKTKGRADSSLLRKILLRLLG
ncbi:MAG: Asp-tRNA(Asn)/Glu-tRNA(Gln) amidotransferase subunit GatB [archaeon]